MGSFKTVDVSVQAMVLTRQEAMVINEQIVQLREIPPVVGAA